ncbi:MAG TPA: glycoside-pentoside-hexuronide (GPH):cation symporter [Candidatus Acidoferrales bacterium]|nr:glycoside-pentoside-hexuronide (GPH):cation symporter [Candidatus Acidoferrales bacterium]
MAEQIEQHFHQKLSFIEKAGYAGGDAAANFVFMTMVCFQAGFYTDVFGLSAGTAATIILVARLWDAFFDPIMGVLADRTHTRWGRFRPWVLWTSIPWAVAMVLAYSTPHFAKPAMIAYAFVTNILLMTLYSSNNMPYSALGAVMTGDVNERAKLNSYRFISTTVAQFVVVGLTLPLVFRLGGPDHNRQHGWQMTMGLWAAICLVLFFITFVVSKERIHPKVQQKTPPKQDFADLFRNGPWLVMWLMTLAQFSVLALMGSAQYNYFHYYADKAAMFDWLQKLGLTAPALAPGAPAPGGILEFLGYIVHGDRANLAGSNVSDVGYSIMQVIGKVVIIAVILSSPFFARRFGKKAVVVAGFTLTAFAYSAFYVLEPTDINGMALMMLVTALVYAPTIPLCWAMFADVADYSEWKNGRRATGIIFATIGFALKAGLSLGGALFLELMNRAGYQANQSQTAQTLECIRKCSTVYVGIFFAICTVLVIAYRLNKRLTIQIADELAERRKQFASENPAGT